MRVTKDVEDLFTEAARVLARTTRRYPVNISSINDIMRHRDRCALCAVHALVGLPAVVFDFYCGQVRACGAELPQWRGEVSFLIVHKCSPLAQLGMRAHLAELC
jgi:hypothetical protein